MRTPNESPERNPNPQPKVTEPQISTAHGPWLPSQYDKGETYCKRCLTRSVFADKRKCDPHIVYSGQAHTPTPAAQRQAEPVAVLKTPEGVIDLRAIAEQAGISMGLWDMGAGSLAFSEGCHGIAREHLEKFASLYGFACWNAALEANPPNMQSFVGRAIDSLFQVPAATHGWQPMETAPRDGSVILGYCVHKADPYYDGGRLTDYGARVEGLDHVKDGVQAICWEDAREESDGWESPSYMVPAGWVHNADPEQMANPILWMPMPPVPVSDFSVQRQRKK